MFGASAKADKGAVKISTNIFAALDTRKKRSTKKETEKPVKEPVVQKVAEKPVNLWTAQQVTVSSWADCEEDDDDYFATTAPLQSWGNVEAKLAEVPVTDDEKVHEESEAEEEEVEDEIDEDVDEEPEGEKDEPPQTKIETEAKPQNPPPKEAERVLSKKELKMKELAELDAVLAELGLANPKDKEEKPSGGSEPPNGTLTKSKSKKKKAKKDKTSEAEAAGETNGEFPKPETDSTSQPAKEETSVKEDSPPVDPRERLKKLASKNKKEKGTSDAAKKAAAAEAASRAAKAAALSKKKEKTHYNQANTR